MSTERHWIRSPDRSEIEYMEEPYVSAEIMVTSDYVGAIMKLCQGVKGA